ncbi:MAG: AbrB/MazE/SpoVT family DNA-binding domain-containing protein [Dehalococcoidia bacterium]|nr:AbrB/MazE/SpoVT family DNA-binding domain-containing protein [Dehalococcoidia bacterium]
MTRSTTVTVDAAGRLTLPAPALAALGIEGAGELHLSIEGGAVVLRGDAAAAPARMEDAFAGFARQVTGGLSPRQLDTFLGTAPADDFAAYQELPEDDFEPEPVPLSGDELDFVRGLLNGKQ